MLSFTLFSPFLRLMDTSLRLMDTSPTHPLPVGGTGTPYVHP